MRGMPRTNSNMRLAFLIHVYDCRQNTFFITGIMDLVIAKKINQTLP